MSHYRSNPRDLEFVLFDLFSLEEVLEKDERTELDGDTVRTMLREAAALAEGPVAASFSVADRNPPVFDPETHEVTLPPEYVESVRAWQEGGWGLVSVDPVVGGVAEPPTTPDTETPRRGFRAYRPSAIARNPLRGELGGLGLVGLVGPDVSGRG